MSIRRNEDSGRLSTSLRWALLLAVVGTWGAGAAFGSGELVPLNAFNLPPGASVTVTFEVDIDNPLGMCATAVTNSGDVTGANFPTVDTDDPDVGGAADPTVTGLDAVDLAITKTDSVASEVPGTPVTYTIVASNAGPSPAVGATVADTFPATLTGVTWTCAGAGGGTCTGAGAGNISDLVNLPVGGSVTYTATGTIAASATGTLVNTATVTKPANTLECNLADNSATDTDTLTPQVDLAITKTNGVTSVDAGSPTTYTIVVTNSGPSDAVSATVADTFPASLTGVTWTCSAAAGSSCTAAGGGHINDLVTVLAGGTLTYSATGTLSGTATGTLVNTATVTAPGGTTDTNGANNSATDTDTINALANLGITKTDGVTTAVPGMTVTYTIVASNAGPATATGATVTDTFPATLTCTWTCVAAGGGTCTAGPVAGNISDSVNLPSGASATYTSVCDIADNASGSLVNTATIGGGGVVDNVPGNNSATDTDTLLTLDFGDAPNSTLGPPWAYPTLLADDGARHGLVASFRLGAAIDAEADGQPTLAADGDDTTGSPDDEDGVALPAVLVTCESASVTVTASAAGQLDAWIDFGSDGSFAQPSDQIFDNQALVAGPNVLAFTVPCAALVTIQTYARFRFSTAGDLAPNDVAADGEVEDYIVAIRGLDFGDAPDPLYPTLFASNGPRHVFTGAGPILGAQVDVEANGQPNATATSDDLAGIPDDEDGVTFTSPIVPGQNATVTVTASMAGVLNAWIDFNGDGGFAQAGDQIFTNQALAAGPNALSFAVPLSADSNTATVARFRLATAGGLSFTGLGADGEVEDHAVTTAPVADLSITKTDGVTTAVPGQSVTYTITAANAGPEPVTGASVADTFPADLTCTWTCVGAGGGTCTAAGSGNIADTVNLPAGGSVTYTASCTIAASATGTLVNTATVSSAVFDPNPGNESATDTDTLTPQADLGITKTDGVASAVPGQSVTYTIMASNPGPSDVPSATVADTFPASLTCTWTCAGANGGTCTAAGSGNINDTVTLPAGGSATYTASCAIAASATGTLSNTATVSSAVTDPNSGNNSATDTDTLTPQADLSITKTDGSASEVPGTDVTYMIVVGNAGPSNAAATVADVFPATLSSVDWTCVGAGGATCTAAGSGNLNDTANLPVGGSVTYTATGDIAPSATGTLVNTATVTATGGATDPNPGNNSATDTDTLAPSADLEIDKEGPATPPPGPNMIYTITVVNHGPSDAAGVVVTDTLPALRVTYVSDDCGGTNGPPWTWNIGTLAVGATVTCNITVSINQPPSSDPISNTADVTSLTPDPGQEPNTDVEVTQVDATAPTVLNVDSVGDTGGPLDECETANVDVSQLLVAFSEDMDDPAGNGDPGDATNPASYLLVATGADLAFDTLACGGAVDDDIAVPIAAVTYDSGSSTATLDLGGTLTDRQYRLFACATLTDLAGNTLDGNGATTGSPDFERNFRVDADNLFANGHFDCDLGSWTTEPVGDWTHDADLGGGDDADGSPESGSVGVTVADTGVPEVRSIGQCVPLVAGDYDFDLRVRLAAAPLVLIGLPIECDFFSAPACGGTLLGTDDDAVPVVQDTGGAWTSEPTTITAPAGAQSALCLVMFDDGPGDAFTGNLDGLRLTGDEVIFADGFESGDASAWSTSVGVAP